MTDLLEPILTELRAVNAIQIGSGFTGPGGQEFRLWRARKRLVLTELYSDGSVSAWRQLDDSNSMVATVDALRAYLAADLT